MAIEKAVISIIFASAVRGKQMAVKTNKKAGSAVLNYSYSPRREEDGRSGIDRRCVNDDVHIPERRSQAERRSGKERRLIIVLARDYA
jgi:hypothetical protein